MRSRSNSDIDMMIAAVGAEVPSYTGLVCERYHDSRMLAACCAKWSLVLRLENRVRSCHDALVVETKKQVDEVERPLLMIASMT
jgi:hypothetical protein